MQKLIAQNYFYRLRIKQFSYGSYGRKYQFFNKSRDDSDEPGFMRLFGIMFQIKDEQDEQVGMRGYKDLLKEGLREDVERLLKVPIEGKMKKGGVNIKGEGNDINISKSVNNSEQMTTNDMSTLKEKIGTSKNNKIKLR